MKHPHVLVRIPSATHGSVRKPIDTLGLTRRIGLHLATWAGIGPALAGTGMLSNHIALILGQCRVATDLPVFEPPAPMPDQSFQVMWRTRLDRGPAFA